MVLLWIVGFAVGMIVTALASRRAVTAALAASAATNISPGLIGITVVAIGTDLPEIANSIVAALTGHGDVVVGDAAGSAMTQVTLVLALLCFATQSIRTDRQTVVLVGGLTAIALFIDALLVSDGVLSRLEGLALVVGWFVLIVVIQRVLPRAPSWKPSGDETSHPPESRRTGLVHAGKAIAWLLLVAVAATLVVRSFIELTDAIGVPELFASAIVLSIGTSLPVSPSATPWIVPSPPTTMTASADRPVRERSAMSAAMRRPSSGPRVSWRSTSMPSARRRCSMALSLAGRRLAPACRASWATAVKFSAT